MHRPAFQEVCFIFGFTVYVAIRGYYERATRGQIIEDSRLDRLEVALLVLVFLGCIAAPCVYFLTPFLHFADYSLPWPLAVLGTVTMITGLWLFWRAHSDLGPNWSASLQIRRGHQLILTGVYTKIRHPMYAAILLFSCSQGMLLSNWLAGWSALFAFGIMCLFRIPREERMMREVFSLAYEEYMSHTGCLFPNRL